MSKVESMNWFRLDHSVMLQECYHSLHSLEASKIVGLGICLNAERLALVHALGFRESLWQFASDLGHAKKKTTM
jgi:hypothetical protein